MNRDGMNLVINAKRVVSATEYTTRDSRPKIVKEWCAQFGRTGTIHHSPEEGVQDNG